MSLWVFLFLAISCYFYLIVLFLETAAFFALQAPTPLSLLNQALLSQKEPKEGGNLRVTPPPRHTGSNFWFSGRCTHCKNPDPWRTKPSMILHSAGKNKSILENVVEIKWSRQIFFLICYFLQNVVCVLFAGKRNMHGSLSLCTQKEKKARVDRGDCLFWCLLLSRPLAASCWPDICRSINLSSNQGMSLSAGRSSW